MQAFLEELKPQQKNEDIPSFFNECSHCAEELGREYPQLVAPFAEFANKARTTQ